MQAAIFSPLGGTTGSPSVQPCAKYHSTRSVPAGTRAMAVVLSGMPGFGLCFVEKLFNPIEPAEQLLTKRVKAVLHHRFEGADLDADCDHEIVVLRRRV